MRTALTQNAHDARANTALGDILMRRGDLQQAESYFERAIHDDPKLASAHYKLSALLIRKHDTERGQRERAIATNLNAEANQARKTQLRLVLPEMKQ